MGRFREDLTGDSGVARVKCECKTEMNRVRILDRRFNRTRSEEMIVWECACPRCGHRDAVRTVYGIASEEVVPLIGGHEEESSEFVDDADMIDGTEE